MIRLCNMIAEDMIEPFLYLTQGLLWGGLAIIVLTVISGLWYLMKKQILFSPIQIICMGIFVSYLYTVLQQTYYSRPPGSRHSVSLILGETWKNDIRSKSYIIENVMMMIPFGILLPMVLKPAECFFCCVPMGFCFSVCIEYAQFLSQRGYMQVDDVVANVSGTILGYFLFLLIRYFCNIWGSYRK